MVQSQFIAGHGVCIIKTKISFLAIRKSQPALKDRIAVSKVRLDGLKKKKLLSPSLTGLYINKFGEESLKSSIAQTRIKHEGTFSSFRAPRPGGLLRNGQATSTATDRR